jgi:hypothetical protein
MSAPGEAVTRPILPSADLEATARFYVTCWIGYPDADAVYQRHDSWAQVPIPGRARLKDVDDAGHLVEFQLIDLHGNLLRLGAPRG